MLFSQQDRHIEVHRRQASGGAWTCDVGEAGQRVSVHGATIDVDAVYG